MLRSLIKEYNLELPAELGSLLKIREFIEKVCREAGMSSADTYNTKLAVDEACTNIIKHAYRDSTGNIQLKVTVNPSRLLVTLTDQGRSFDWGSVPVPDLEEYAKTGKRGGLGIMIMGKLMDKLEYRVRPEGNVLTMTKALKRVKRPVPKAIGIRRLSFRLRFALFTSLILFLLTVGAFYYIFKHEEGMLKTEVLNRGEAIARNLAASSIDPLLLSPPNDLRLADLVNEVMRKNSDVRYIAVIDTYDKIWAHSDLSKLFQSYKPPPGVKVSERGEISRQYYWSESGEALYDIAVPIMLDIKRLGIVHLGLSLEKIKEPLAKVRQRMLYLALAVLMAGIISALVLISVMWKPVRRVAEEVIALGEGRLSEEILKESGDEFGQIARIFSEMTSRYDEAQRSLANKLADEKARQKEMELAQEIQHALLPAQCPEIEGYEIAAIYKAAKEVGGDYYDFTWIDENTIGVVVADVSGKGVPGSLLMSAIKMALQYEAVGNKSAAKTLVKLNSSVVSKMKLEKGMFVTMFYIVLDSRNRIINFASAGHNPLILYRSEKRETYFLKPRGFPLGISLEDGERFNHVLTKERIKLMKGDMLILYTDGITEAMNGRRELFGERRLVEVIKNYGHLSPKEFVEALEEEINKFTGGLLQNDDITLVAIKEKVMADEVQFNFRKQLLDLVEKEGLSIAAACDRLKVSQATYYKYKHLRDQFGEQGLMSKVLRALETPQQISLEDREKVKRIVKEHPDFGPQRISLELDTEKYGYTKISPHRLRQELRRLRLNTKERRLEFAQRRVEVERKSVL